FAGGFVLGAQFQGNLDELPRLGLAAGAILVVDEIVGIGVISVATREPFQRLLSRNWDIRLGTGLARFALAILAAYLLVYKPFLVIGIPVTVFGLYLVSQQRVRAREERTAWQELARTTNDFTSVELDAVLSAAVLRAARLFSVDEAEVEVVDAAAGPRRVVRGDDSGVHYDGPPETAPPAPGPTISMALESREGLADVGELRLRFRGRVALSERENYTLQSFADALSTAIRNAIVHARTVAMNSSNEHAATHDQLTGLANRRHLEEEGQRALDAAEAGMPALLVIDLDHFKEINDALGHAAGDRVLAEVALRLAAAAQEGDLVARLGGDEFAVLMSGLGAPALAVPRARVLLGALSEPLAIEGMRLGLRASAGVAVAPPNGDVRELLRRADLAMYHAKRSSQGISLYSDGMDVTDAEQMQLNAELPRAIARREFTLEFQPVVDLGTGEVISAEALARWRHPRQGDLSPAHFIDSVERSTLLPAFSAAVLDEALQAVDTWRSAGWDFPVAVNVSARSILNPDFPEIIRSHLTRAELPPEALILEITESVTLSQLEVVDEVLRRLGELGVRLALDDFGTGYSSLATLARVPVHELKIDRAFVSRMDHGTEGAVVRGTVDLGRSLNMLVVAEGVENEEQRRQLWELGCPAGQGHLFARSLSLSRFMDALRRGYAGRPGALAAALHDEGAVIRLPQRRPSSNGHQRRDDTG
ncbi:MAG TPA: bifunctional diguanylate cyclase/phosphodiesterase, partial [Rugosimonospora sp.]|nr:bifunctional diguanylate cyclase/phosphodiesterase [Rugosimonospora sp.]